MEPALYLVSTPIGNLEDMTARAVRVLNEADLILAEDTRHSRILLDHYGIKGHCESYHDFNKEKRTPALVRYLEEGNSIALISDAGTPGIADPGYYIVRAARAAGVAVVPVPGPCAFIAALCASGMPTDRFSFQNFPPKKSAGRIRELESIRDMWPPDTKHVPTLGYYVGTGQVVKFLREIGQVFGKTLRVVLARELTKKFEEFLDNTVEGHLEHYRERKPRGEYVFLFHPLGKG